jgi:hypothetical protein
MRAKVAFEAGRGADEQRAGGGVAVVGVGVCDVAGREGQLTCGAGEHLLAETVEARPVVMR